MSWRLPVRALMTTTPARLANDWPRSTERDEPRALERARRVEALDAHDDRLAGAEAVLAVVLGDRDALAVLVRGHRLGGQAEAQAGRGLAVLDGEVHVVRERHEARLRRERVAGGGIATLGGRGGGEHEHEQQRQRRRGQSFAHAAEAIRAMVSRARNSRYEARRARRARAPGHPGPDARTGRAAGRRRGDGGQLPRRLRARGRRHARGRDAARRRRRGRGHGRGVGEGVERFAPGDRVAWSNAPGSYAERVLVSDDAAVALPDGISTEVAAAVILQGTTAHYLAVSTYPIQPGDTVIVHAAAGGVGLLLTQIAKRRGGRVIATTSTDEKAELARGARRRRDDRLRRLRRAGARADRRRGCPRGLRRHRRDDVRRVARRVASARLHGVVRRREWSAAAGGDREAQREVALPDPPDARALRADGRRSCGSARERCSSGSPPASSTSASAAGTRWPTPPRRRPTSNRAAPRGS